MSENTNRLCAVVMYESMYGNTRAIAEAIGTGLSSAMDVDVLSVAEERAAGPCQVDLLVLGGPTHTWGMSRPGTRKAAAQAADKPQSGLSMQPGWDGAGLREWLVAIRADASGVATFDTRMKAPLGLSGSAARAIARKVRRQGYRLTGSPIGFIVSRQNRLVDGELARAEAWGRALAAKVTRVRDANVV
jgi:Flavodoxin